MDIKGQTVGDIKTWATKILHDELESIINAKSGHDRPYYILVHMKEGYEGMPAYGNNNELLHGKGMGLKPHDGETKAVDLSKKRVMTHRFILMNKPPLIPLVGTSVWYINNKTGEVKCLYILPPDKPMIGGFDVELNSITAAKCGANMPYIHGSN